MAPRITISTSDDCELQIFLNEDGRDLLVRELLRLSKGRDHFHLGTYETAEIQLRDRPYSAADTVVPAAKILLCPDEWDRRHFPYVLDSGD